MNLGENCPSYRGARVFNKYLLFGHQKMFFLDGCPSYEISVLRGFTVYTSKATTVQNYILRYLIGNSLNDTSYFKINKDSFIYKYIMWYLYYK